MPSSHDGVPDESVEALDLVEELARIIGTKRGEAGGETKKAACGEDVPDEFEEGHLGMDLEEFIGFLIYRWMLGFDVRLIR